ncbi:hypothetical protein JCM33374_g1978 [Metschnikowia sp. JCM 33374]|nr:hypothetical protein JCM33374_g1978 [Metschnikowia sp. JCM 33374]
MSANNSKSQDGPLEFSPNDESLAVCATSMPTEIPVIIPEHEYYLNFPTGLTSAGDINPPAYPPVDVFHRTLEAETAVQARRREDDLYSNSEDSMGIFSPWSGGPLGPITSWASTDHHSKTSITALPTPPAVFPDIFMAPAFQDQTVGSIPNLTASPLHNAFHSSTTEGPRLLILESDPLDTSRNFVNANLEVTNVTTSRHGIPSSDKLSISHADSALLQEVSPLTISADSVVHAKSSEEVNAAFNRLVPLLKTVHSRNLGSFLLKVLKEFSRHVPLEEFYCIIYSTDGLNEIHIPRGEPLDVNHELTQKRLTEIKLHYRIRESFRIPETFQNGIFQQSMLPTVNFHEFLRTFLAMKILSGCLTRVADPSQTISRLSMYKVYCIIFQKLFLKYSEIWKSSWSPQKHVLGQPKIGKVTKLIHPDLGWKRLGKRGESKVHYIGVTWNRAIVDHDTLSLLDLDVTDLSDYFASRTIPPKRSPVTRPQEPQKIQHIFNQQLSPIPMLSPSKPLLSFVDFSSRYPDWECSPRVWNLTPNLAPKQSEWATITMTRSVEVLKRHGVNLDPLITKLNTGNFAVDKYSISGTVLQSVNVLRDSCSPKETYLHLYLAVILLLLPTIIASDQEVPKVSKAQLRASMKECALKLENEFAVLPHIDSVSVTTFAGVLRKMIHINEMTSSSVKVSTEVVFKEMIHDVKRLTTKVDYTSNISAFEEVFIKAATTAMYAYSYDPFSKTATNDTAYITNMHQIGNAFQDVVLMAARNILPVPLHHKASEMQKDVPYQLFHLSAKLFHQITLSHPEIRCLPIRIITFIISYFLNEMQRVSFAEFAKRDPAVSQETFKSWWIYSSMFQEYMGVMSEVVALSQNLV